MSEEQAIAVLGTPAPTRQRRPEKNQETLGWGVLGATISCTFQDGRIVRVMSFTPTLEIDGRSLSMNSTTESVAWAAGPVVDPLDTVGEMYCYPDRDLTVWFRRHKMKAAALTAAGQPGAAYRHDRPAVLGVKAPHRR